MIDQELPAEDIDDHAARCPAGVAGPAAGLRRLFLELADPTFGVHGQHAQPNGFFHRHVDAGHGDVGTAVHMLFQHHAVVHFVDVVAGQHQHQVGRRFVEQLEVLEHGVGCSAVPVVANLLLRRHQVDELAQGQFQETPAVLDMPDLALGPELREHANAPDAGFQS